MRSLRFCPSCALPLGTGADASDPLLGRTLAGRYRIDSVLGEGGMGRVYVATQQLGVASRRVAVKVLLPEHADEPALASRFLHEVGLAAQLDHPNTVRVYDAGRTDDGRLFVAMELLDGEPLSAVLLGGPLDLARVERIVGQVCASLTEAHRKGIVHRDVKPDNVMLCRVGDEIDVVKLLDFGIARRLKVDGGARLTRQGTLLGTPQYMSPEQAAGGEVDARSDVYSLAVMTYEMISGRLPFSAVSLLDWVSCHLSAVPLALESTPAGSAAPEATRRAVLRALSKRPEDRPSSVRELYSELTPFADRASLPWSVGQRTPALPPAVAAGTVAGTPAWASPLPASPPSGLPVPRRPRSWLYALGGGAVVAGLVAAAAALLGVRVDSPDRGSFAPAATTAITGSPEITSRPPPPEETAPNASTAPPISSRAAVAAAAPSGPADEESLTRASADVAGTLAKGCAGAGDLVAAAVRLGDHAVKDAAYAKVAVNARKYGVACAARNMADAQEHGQAILEAMRHLRRR